MYLSKIIVDIRHPSARQALRDANDMHRNLMAGFPMVDGQPTPRADAQILYRLFSRRDQVFLLMSSAERPDAAALAKNGLYTDDAMMRNISGMKQVLQPGRLLRFELIASPCKKVDDGGNNSRRVFLSTPEERLGWLRRKGEAGGFEVVQASEMSGRLDIQGKRGSMGVKNSGILFSGVLRITDSDAFWQSYILGIGPGKAYGLGMLNVANV